MHITSLVDFYSKKDEIPPRPCSEKQRIFMEKAARVAMKSTMTHQHGCIIVGSDGTILYEGYNHHKFHMSHTFSIHAEVDALYKAKKGKYKLTDCEMYVVRIGPQKFDHCLKYSKPCPNCTKEIQKNGIKRVYYSTNHEYDEYAKAYGDTSDD